jgi:hypothetical protein
MPRTEAQNKWVNNNRDYYNELQNVYVKAHYIKNREAKLEYAKQYREENKELLSIKRKEKYQQKKQQLAQVAQE